MRREKLNHISDIFRLIKSQTIAMRQDHLRKRSVGELELKYKYSKWRGTAKSFSPRYKQSRYRVVHRLILATTWTGWRTSKRKKWNCNKAASKLLPCTWSSYTLSTSFWPWGFGKNHCFASIKYNSYSIYIVHHWTIFISTKIVCLLKWWS